MSLENILRPNNYDLFGNDISIIQPKTGFQKYHDCYTYFLSLDNFGFNIDGDNIVYYPLLSSLVGHIQGNLTEVIRSQALKGWKLISIDVLYQVVGGSLVSASVDLTSNLFVEGSLTVTSIPLTGSLALTPSNMHVSTVTINNPIFVADNVMYNSLLTFQTDGTATCNFYGLFTNFERNDL
jgi:hypothetical protein